MTLHANFNTGAARVRGLGPIGANIGANAMLGQISDAVADMREKQDKAITDIKKELDTQARQIAGLRVGGAGSDHPRQPGDPAKDAALLAGAARDTLKFNASMSTDSSGDGGYLVAPTVSDSIQLRQFDQSALARLARRETIETGDSFEEPWDIGDVGSAWVGERESRPETETAEIKKMTYFLMELYALRPITQRLLDDSKYDLGGWLAGRIADKLGRAAGSAFFIGDGENKPRGLSTYTHVATADATRAWGEIQRLPTGASGAFATATTSVSPGDVLVSTVYALKAEHRRNARWIMNSATAAVVRKLKDAEGRFLWSDSLVAGQPSTLLGYAVEIDEYAPDIAANTNAIWFGDFKRAYLIVDRPGLKLLRDPYTSRPNVLFYAYARVGGGLADSEAVKAVYFGS
jgi:HK97 family phage major capsid protein